MLDSIRNTTNSWVTKIFFAILLLCFVFLWGIPQLNIKNESNLLTSGKSVITVDDYRLALADYSLRLALASQLGRMLSPDEIQQYGIPAFVFYQLQQDILFDEQARKMKINLSQDALAHIISSDSIFQTNGNFNRNLFLNYLQQLNISQSHFLDYYTQREKRNQLILASLSGAKIPNLFYEAFALHSEEKRTADYLVVDLEKEKKISTPNKETLQKWFDTHRNMFRAPEYRTVSLLSITPNDFVKLENISANEAMTYYNQNASRFTVPEKRVFEELRFPTREAADEAAQKIANGMSFDQLVQSEKKTLKDIKKGPLAESELPNYLASDIFELKQGQISAVISDLQGPIIVRVMQIIPSGPIPFEDIEQDIRQTLAQNRAVTDLRSKYTEIENARFEGASLKELADQYNLSLRQITIDKEGKTIEGVMLTDLPQKEIVLSAIYQATEGSELDPLSLQEGGYLWYQVDAITPARDKALEEVEKEAVAEWKNAKIQQLLDEKANNILKQLTEGKSLDSLAAKLSVKKKTTPALRRQDSSDILGIEGVKALFSGPKGHYGIIKGAVATNRIIYKITESSIPKNVTAQTIPSDIREDMDMTLKEDLKLGMLQIANEEHPIEINGSNYNQLFSTSQ
ncbi:hypothetical protein H704_00484 [Bartonella bacilliformis Peru38]|uniref:peptidyl-prolyl cis-trans isomerase n=1 Tax=Bartonella bacilliformis TaxID=774 RepID=UPI0004A0F5BF|nr:peptidyl-prolyl cis-trans isomerase [Bartonella bacilliformis]KEG20946.1 hypothetical protein H704_00484 [Bartonella bacilliformis Peru38]